MRLTNYFWDNGSGLLFKEGDMVRLIENIEDLRLAGDVGQIVELDSSDRPYEIKFKNNDAEGGFYMWVCEHEIELINEVK